MADSRDGGDGLPLLRVRHALLRAWSFLDSKHLNASRPDSEQALALTHLDLFACQLQRPWQPIEDAIVGDVAIPGHFALFSGEAFPRKVLGQGQQLLLGETIDGPCMGRAMDTGGGTPAPRRPLAIEIVEVGKCDPTP